LYKTPGKEISRKRDILDFSGFVYEDEVKDREKKVVALEKIFQKPRFQIMDMFDLPRGSGAEGSKEAQIERILKFLEKPAATEGRQSKVELKEKKKAKVAAKATKKRKKTEAKKKKAATKAAKPAKAVSNEVAKLKKQNADLKKKLEAALQKIE
jgi:protein DEK